MIAAKRASEPMLLCRVGSRLCALPLEHVGETMRPLPVERLAGVPAFILGLSVIRGTPTPVIDAGGLLLGTEERFCPTRFVTIKAGPRHVALAVDEVVGVRAVPSASLGELPPLLRDASTEVVEAVGTLDGFLLLVLKSARILPSSVWSAIEATEARP